MPGGTRGASEGSIRILNAREFRERKDSMHISATVSPQIYQPPHFLLYEGDLERSLASIARIGYRHVELHLRDTDIPGRKRVWDLLKRYRLNLTSIGTGRAYEDWHYNLVDRDAAVRKRCIRHLETHMQTLAPYGGMLIAGNVIGSEGDSGLTGAEHEEMLLESLHRLDRTAGRLGVGVCVELQSRYERLILNRVSEGVDLMRKGGFSHTGLHLDTATLNIEEADIGKAILAARGLLFHVHVADNDRCYPGHGHYNFPETLSALKEVGYGGALAIEAEPFPTAEEAAARSLVYLKEALSRIGEPAD